MMGDVCSESHVGGFPIRWIRRFWQDEKTQLVVSRNEEKEDFHTKKGQPPQTQHNLDDQEKMEVDNKMRTEKKINGATTTIVAKTKIAVLPRTSNTVGKKRTRTVKYKGPVRPLPPSKPPDRYPCMAEEDDAIMTAKREVWRSVVSPRPPPVPPDRNLPTAATGNSRVVMEERKGSTVISKEIGV